MDRASTFFRSEMYAWSNICSDRKQMFCGIIYSSLSIQNVYCFSQKNICNQSENVSEYISMLQKYKNNSLSVRTIFPVPANMHFEGTLESFWTKPHLEINIVYARSVGEIFPPYTLYTRTRGRPFWGGYVCSRAASQISECLWRMLFLIQNITCYLCRNLYEKIFVKRYTVWEILVINMERNYFLARWDVSKKKCVTLQVL